MKNRKRKNKIFLYLLIILGITVGYALLSTTLNINGTAGIKKNTWDIHWDEESIQVTENSVQAETPTVTEDGQKVSYEVTLELPGDFYEFTIDAVNAGTIDGMISVGSIEPIIKDKTTGQTTTLPNYIKYSVTYADGSPVEEFHLLPKRVDENTPTREKFKVRIEYDSKSSSLPDTDKEYKIDGEIPYIPDDGRGKRRDALGSRTVYKNHLGKSETLDPTWTYYYEVKLDETIADHDMYTISVVTETESIDLYTAWGLIFDTKTECDNFRNLAGSNEYSCEVRMVSGTKYEKKTKVSACIKTPIGDDFCYEYGKYDCQYDENAEDCDNTSTYTLQKKNEILSKGGFYKTSLNDQMITDPLIETIFGDNSSLDNVNNFMYVAKGNTFGWPTWIIPETIMLGNKDAGYRCVYMNGIDLISDKDFDGTGIGCYK